VRTPWIARFDGLLEAVDGMSGSPPPGLNDYVGLTLLAVAHSLGRA